MGGSTDEECDCTYAHAGRNEGPGSCSHAIPKVAVQVKFYPGDMYIYQGTAGETVLWVRSNEGAWVRAFVPAGEALQDATDFHVENAVKQDILYPQHLRPVFIRAGKVLDTTTL